MCYVSDGASVNYTVAQHNNTDIQRCSTHLLSLLVKDICQIGHIFELYQQCHSIRKVIYKSNIEYAKFRDAQAAVFGSRTVCKIQNFSETRWNDCINLFRSVNENLPAIEIYFVTSTLAKEFAQNANLDLFFIKSNIESIIEVLHYIDNLTKQLSGENSSLGDVYLSIKRLKEFVCPLIRNLSMGEDFSIVKRRCDELLTDEFVIASCLLNPKAICPVVVNGALRTKSTSVPSLDYGINVMKSLFNKYKIHFEHSPVTSEYEIDIKMRNEHQIISSQCYNDQETSTQFWTRLKCVAPHLYIVATLFSCIRPSSVACERVFSKAKKYMRPDRCRLEPSTLDTLLFLKNNESLFLDAVAKRKLTWKLKESHEDSSNSIC